MSFARKEKQGEDGYIRLKIEGSMSIYETPALREELLACFENGEGLEVDLGGVTDCDAAGLQLLYAARRTAEEEKKRFQVSSVSQTVLDALRSAALNADEVL